MSTPLIMHFSTSLALWTEKVRSISDLYDRVVQESLERDFIVSQSRPVAVRLARPTERPQDGHPPLQDCDDGRVALAILSSDANAVRLEASEDEGGLTELVERLVQRPEAASRTFPWRHAGILGIRTLPE